MNKARLTVIVVGVMLGLSSFATAVPLPTSPITQIKPFGGLPNFSSTLTFDEFDDIGGALVLTSIEIIISLEVSGGYLILDNDGAGPAVGTFEFGSKADISSIDVPLSAVGPTSVTGEVEAIHLEPFALDADNGDGPLNLDATGPDGLDYSGGVETDSDSGFIDPALHSQYVGTSTYDITVDATQWNDYGAVGGIELFMTPSSASGEVTVIYNFVPTPEPATLSLLAIGGAALLKRRRR